MLYSQNQVPHRPHPHHEVNDGIFIEKIFNKPLDYLMIRSRLLEQYERVIREDMLTLFNRTASIRSLECSVVLHGASMLNSETKYKAACILEILTGQRVNGASCEVVKEDPLRRVISEEQQKDLDRIRGMALRQSILASQKKGNPGKKVAGSAPTSLTVDDLRKLGNGFKLKTILTGVKLFDFLEKCREFYLPDVIGIQESNGKILPDAGHPNHLKHAHVTGHFERYTPSKQFRRELRPIDNPTEAITSYLLKSSDLLKFPDIELHFESMGSLVSRDSSDDSTTLHLILRPTLRIEKSVVPELAEFDHQSSQQYDHLKIMNYCLSQYFNMYMRRPRVSGSKNLN